MYNPVMSPARRAAPVLFLLLMLSALACNLPAAAPRAGSPGEQETLQARLFPTRAPALPAGTAVPEMRGTAPGAIPTPLPAGQPFAGLVLAQPGRIPDFLTPLDSQPYLTQPGDTFAALAQRFSVAPGTIRFPADFSGGDGLLPAGTTLQIDPPPVETLPGLALLPDSEIIYGPPAADFDIQVAIDSAGGYLSRYRETLDGEEMTGAQAVRRIALETSINPRLLLAVLEFRAGWVSGEPRNREADFPYKELALVTRQLTQAYYGWRAGTFEVIEFMGGASARPNPRLNAGSVALQNLFAKLYPPAEWGAALYGSEGFLALYMRMYGDPWARAAAFEPLLPDDLAASQPEWQLPFTPGEQWSFTGGPHIAWGVGSPLGALDFAPADEAKGCYTSARWAIASVAGVVARSERGVLVLDTDGDGFEQTGWTLLYLHLADAERLPVGARSAQDDRLGHPSCEGGPATGKHVHIVRRYNGEWIGVSNVLPFILSGWWVKPGLLPYQGRLLKEGQVVESRTDGSAPARIVR
jgi:LasA protease